jgi:hypothetical protein
MHEKGGAMHHITRLPPGQVAVAVAAFFLVAPCTAIAQSREIKGITTDSATRPVPYVQIHVSESGIRAISDDSGRFRVRLSDWKAVTLVFRRIGFYPAQVMLPVGGDTSVAIILSSSVHALSAAHVVANRSIEKLATRGFFDRMRDKERGANTGHFITQEEIEQRHLPPLTQLLRGLPSVQINYARAGIAVPMSTMSGGCVMTTYLDGVRFEVYNAQKLTESTSRFPHGGVGSPMHPPESDRSAVRRRDVVEWGLDFVVQTTTVAGIEVYPRPGQAPPQYQTLNGACGVILIWTK